MTQGSMVRQAGGPVVLMVALHTLVGYKREWDTWPGIMFVSHKHPKIDGISPWVYRMKSIYSLPRLERQRNAGIQGSDGEREAH